MLSVQHLVCVFFRHFIFVYAPVDLFFSLFLVLPLLIPAAVPPPPPRASVAFDDVCGTSGKEGGREGNQHSKSEVPSTPLILLLLQLLRIASFLQPSLPLLSKLLLIQGKEQKATPKNHDYLPPILTTTTTTKTRSERKREVPKAQSRG